MSNNYTVLNKANAIVVIQMQEVCWSEGVGPDCTDLMRRIRNKWPDLVEQYAHLPWPDPTPDDMPDFICRRLT